MALGKNITHTLKHVIDEQVVDKNVMHENYEGTNSIVEEESRTENDND